MPRESRLTRLYRETPDLGTLKTDDLLKIVQHFADESNYEDAKEAASEIDRRLGTKIREAVGRVSDGWSDVQGEINQAARNLTSQRSAEGT
jgi:hypothetical protein